MDVGALVALGGYAAIFALMIANGFISFPSSQILYIIVGYFISTGRLLIIPASLLGALGNTIGNIVLYEVVRVKGIHYIKKFGIFPQKDIQKVEIVFKKKGLWFLFIGKLLPAIKVFVPIPAALGKVNRGMFAGIMFAASLLWSFIFIAIGYFFGKSTELWKSYGVILMIVALCVVLLFYKYMNSIEIIKELEGGGVEVSNEKSDK